ncbi:Dabb family protein [Aporhodopirellula aestuarii]|uniref:Dabb family protein n=1 Tax=Aporhodopirellula aestuarii TaxID=2950107 RepID=A0ABT0TZK9_9BACT|nr:Dabb family protein [Aporhodopirellula aestuarii]MCM2370033.1 Dabb family protein [Aporhodopirellula aestuarii]
MKTSLSLFVILCLVAITTMQVAAVGSDAKSESKLLRHVVMFGFKESSSEAEIQNVVDEFAKLPGKIDSIVEFEHGVNNSPEGLNDGLTHCFLVSFADEAGRAEYLPHPAHKAFVEVLKPHMEKVVVVDYWAQ